MMNAMHGTLKIDHPAKQALEAALRACDGAITPNEVAVSACVYPPSSRPDDRSTWQANQHWGHRDTVAIYPASVMKLFLLAVLADQRQNGQIDCLAEDNRAAEAMIRESSNEATVYLLGRVTGSEDGSCVAPAALADWGRRRALVQEWFLAKGGEYEDISLLHATYQDSPYGRAQQARTPDNANKLTAVAGARLMHDIAKAELAGSAWMMELLDRQFQRQPDYENSEGDQVRGFLAEGLPPDVKVWSKAGHTSRVRHDLLYAELPEGVAFVLSVMTEGEWSSRNGKFLPEFARAFHRAVIDTNQTHQEKISTGGTP